MFVGFKEKVKNSSLCLQNYKNSLFVSFFFATRFVQTRQEVVVYV